MGFKEPVIFHSIFDCIDDYVVCRFIDLWAVINQGGKTIDDVALVGPTTVEHARSSIARCIIRKRAIPYRFQSPFLSKFTFPLLIITTNVALEQTVLFLSEYC